jgi:hypothetical protein
MAIKLALLAICGLSLANTILVERQVSILDRRLATVEAITVYARELPSRMAER